MRIPVLASCEKEFRMFLIYMHHSSRSQFKYIRDERDLQGMHFRSFIQLDGAKLHGQFDCLYNLIQRRMIHE